MLLRAGLDRLVFTMLDRMQIRIENTHTVEYTRKSLCREDI